LIQIITDSSVGLSRRDGGRRSKTKTLSHPLERTSYLNTGTAFNFTHTQINQNILRNQLHSLRAAPLSHSRSFVALSVNAFKAHHNYLILWLVR